MGNACHGVCTLCNAKGDGLRSQACSLPSSAGCQIRKSEPRRRILPFTADLPHAALSHVAALLQHSGSTHQAASAQWERLHVVHAKPRTSATASNRGSAVVLLHTCAMPYTSYIRPCIIHAAGIAPEDAERLGLALCRRLAENSPALSASKPVRVREEFQA